MLSSVSKTPKTIDFNCRFNELDNGLILTFILPYKRSFNFDLEKPIIQYIEMNCKDDD